MKQTKFSLFFIFFALLLASCGSKDESETISREEAIESLLEKQIDLNAEGVLTFMIADRLDVVDLMLIAGINPNAIVMEAPLLVWASSMGKTEAVRLLLRHGARVNIRDKGVSPLMIAAMEGHEHVVSELLAHNANIDLQNENGMTALMSAAYGGHHEIVRKLLRQGANADLEMLNGMNAEELAESEGHLQTALLLREHRNAVF